MQNDSYRSIGLVALGAILGVAYVVGCGSSSPGDVDAATDPVPAAQDCEQYQILVASGTLVDSGLFQCADGSTAPLIEECPSSDGLLISEFPGPPMLVNAPAGWEPYAAGTVNTFRGTSGIVFRRCKP